MARTVQTKRRKWTGSKNDKKVALGIDNGCKGVLVTSSCCGNERRCIREVMNALSANGDGATDENALHALTEDDVDVEAAIEREINQLKEKAKRFIPLMKIAKNMTFLKFNDDADIPSYIVHKLLMDLKQSENLSYRFTARIIPLDVVFRPFEADFKLHVVPLIAKHFPYSYAATLEAAGCKNATESITEKEAPQSSLQIRGYWSCAFGHRNTSTIGREFVLNTLTEYVGDAYKVNLQEPDLTVVVEVTPIFCGVSIVEGYTSLKGFSISKLIKLTRTQE